MLADQPAVRDYAADRKEGNAHDNRDHDDRDPGSENHRF
jgi:hypothetical protein